MTRARLPDRRSAETLDLQHAGLRYIVTAGFYPDGCLGEIFIKNHKAGNASDTTARDGGILISLLLQHGCTVETIANAVSRNSDGTPAGVIGAVLDLVARRS